MTRKQGSSVLFGNQAIAFLFILLGNVAAIPLMESSASGQTVYGSIFGTITDLQGAAIVGARVSVVSVQKGTRFETTTDGVGNYGVSHLIPDQYNIRADAPKFKSIESINVYVYADQAARINMELPVGGPEEKLTVSADNIPLLKTDRADVATTFTAKEVESLPILNRNFTSLELLTPGASLLAWQHSSAENPQGGIQVMINGQHFSGTSYQLDGTDNRDPLLGIIVINPTLESVAQTKITTQNYDAEFGQVLAGVVSVQTKSGTNNVHGSVFDFRRTDWGQARNPFTQPPDRPLPSTKWNQFGGSFGGPLLKNRLFVFADYQGTRRSSGNSLRLSVPTALVRSTCLDPAVLLCDLSEYPSPIFDPATGNQFINNQIPRNRVSTQATKLLKLLPVPNNGAEIRQNFIVSGAERFNDDDFNFRVDQNVTSKIQIFGRYSFADFRKNVPGAFGDVAGGPGLSADGVANKSLSRNQSLAFGLTDLLAPDLLADFRFGFFRYHVNVLPNDVGTTPAKDAGIPGINTGDILTSGMPFISYEGQAGEQLAFGINCGCPLFETEQQFQWVSNWTKIAGKHNIKWGADFRYAQNLRIASSAPRSGFLNFFNARTGGPTGGGLGLASFLLGDVSLFGRTASSVTDAGERQKRWFFYGQDTYRITPKVTLNYGLRWEIYFPQSVTGKGAGGWVDLQSGLVNVAGYGGINLQGNVRNNFTNFAPRLGIAYEATSKTVIRLGYGRSFDIGVFGSTFGHTATQNLPVLISQQVLPSSIDGTVFNLSTGPPAPEFVKVPATGQFMLPDQVGAQILTRKIRLPTLDAWNVTIQREITPTLSLSVGYVGNKGTHVFAGDSPSYDSNQATITGFGTLDTFQRKPYYQKFGWTQPLSYYGNDASDNYHALLVAVEKRFAKGYQFLAHYTWSKALGFDSDYFAVDPRLNYGVASTDRKHAFVLTSVIDLPFGKGKVFLGDAKRTTDLMVGGWTLSGTATWQSGLPFSPTYSSCFADRDTGPCRPNLVGPVHITGDRSHYFTTTDGVLLAQNGALGDTVGPWQRPAAGTFGSAARNSLRAPRFFQSDLSVSKNVPLVEKSSLQFRADIFNLFNHVNLDVPQSCVDCPNGGMIINTAFNGIAIQRQIMFSLRLQF